MSVARLRHRLSVDDYEAMFRTGILTENDRVELINGEIVEKLPVGDEHIACVRRLIEILHERIGRKATIGSQDAIRLDDSEPEPDVTLLQRRDDFYASGKARPRNVLLVIEVSDSSLDYDRTVKLQLYARNGIQEYWICNLVDRQVEVHRGPLSSGSYAQSSIHRGGEAIEPAAFPGVPFRVDEILG
jgi:Uma2 family endonuclease